MLNTVSNTVLDCKEERKGVFGHVQLTGAKLFWLFDLLRLFKEHIDWIETVIAVTNLFIEEKGNIYPVPFIDTLHTDAVIYFNNRYDDILLNSSTYTSDLISAYLYYAMYYMLITPLKAMKLIDTIPNQVWDLRILNQIILLVLESLLTNVGDALCKHPFIIEEGVLKCLVHGSCRPANNNLNREVLFDLLNFVLYKLDLYRDIYNSNNFPSCEYLDNDPDRVCVDINNSKVENCVTHDSLLNLVRLIMNRYEF